jgi:hypothetical protein
MSAKTPGFRARTNISAASQIALTERFSRIGGHGQLGQDPHCTGEVPLNGDTALHSAQPSRPPNELLMEGGHVQRPRLVASHPSATRSPTAKRLAPYLTA